jgi:hypothetical protein
MLTYVSIPRLYRAYQPTVFLIPSFTDRDERSSAGLGVETCRMAVLALNGLYTTLLPEHDMT